MEAVPRRLLLFATTTGYQIREFDDAARRLGVELTLASDRCHIMEDPWGDRAIAVKFDRIAESLEALRGLEFDGIAAVGDLPAVLAAAAAEALGVPFHPPAAARACHDKFLARQLYQAAGHAAAAILSRDSWQTIPRALADAAHLPLRAEAAGTFRQPGCDPRQRRSGVRRRHSSESGRCWDEASFCRWRATSQAASSR